jgi:uncharacterized protein (TIGR03083 family)
MSSRTTIEALDAECLALSRVLQSLTPEELARPTNCPPWTLHELVVHIVDSITVPDLAVPRSVDGVPPGTTADYYRRPERHTDQYRRSNVERTRTQAATIPPETTAALFRDAWHQTSRAFAESDLDQRTEAAGLALTLGDYVLTRLMSVVAHGLDVALTLDRPPWTTHTALKALRPVLVDLLGKVPPITWTDQDLLELGTGRRSLTETERDAVGPLAARFPLLS